MSIARKALELFTKIFKGEERPKTVYIEGERDFRPYDYSGKPTDSCWGCDGKGTVPMTGDNGAWLGDQECPVCEGKGYK